MNIICPDNFLRLIYPNALWRVKTNEKKLFITFDDGPIPEVTPQILDILDEHKIKATFFCVAHNIDKHPDIFKSLIEKEHGIGNHTYNHLSGLKLCNSLYFNNIRKAEKLIKNKLFRPPHGIMRPYQYIYIRRKMKYKIVLWDVLTKDYDQKTSPRECLNNAIKYAREGSIIVFHDSIKAEKNVIFALPRMIKHFKEKGYTFDKLSL